MGLGSLCQAIGDQLEPVDLEAHGDRRESDGIGWNRMEVPAVLC